MHEAIRLATVPSVGNVMNSETKLGTWGSTRDVISDETENACWDGLLLISDMAEDAIGLALEAT